MYKSILSLSSKDDLKQTFIGEITSFPGKAALQKR